jgi:RNA polymerase sigma-70 factor (ECF subfamily)
VGFCEHALEIVGVSTNFPAPGRYVMAGGVDDAELVRASLAGERQAFAQLVERYQKPIYNVALRIVHDTEDARDLTQTVFLRAFDRLVSYDPSYKFFNWIYRIAINEAIDHVAAHRRLAPLAGNEVSASPDPHSELGRAEAGRAVRAALMGLRAEHRAVLVLRHYLHCSYAEMGEILAIPEHTVKSRLFTARQQLKDRLVERGAVE